MQLQSSLPWHRTFMQFLFQLVGALNPSMCCPRPMRALVQMLPSLPEARPGVSLLASPQATALLIQTTSTITELHCAGCNAHAFGTQQICIYLLSHLFISAVRVGLCFTFCISHQHLAHAGLYSKHICEICSFRNTNPCILNFIPFVDVPAAVRPILWTTTIPRGKKKEKEKKIIVGVSCEIYLKYKQILEQLVI